MSVGRPTGIYTEIYGRIVNIYFTLGLNADYCGIDYSPTNSLAVDAWSEEYGNAFGFDSSMLPTFNKAYTYSLVCYDSATGEYSPWVTGLTFVTGPDIPTNVKATVSGLNVTITFTKPSGATVTYLDSNDGGSEYDYSTTGSSFSLPVPWYNYTYYFYLQCKNSSGSYGEWTVPFSFTTGNPPAAPTPPIITRRFDGGLDLQCGSISGASTYYFEYRIQGNTTWIQTTSATNTKTITGLQYGTAYEFRAKTNLSETYSSINIGTTSPQSPTISGDNVTYDSVRINIEPLSGNCDKVIVWGYEAEGTSIGYKEINPSGRTSPSTLHTTFSGLNRNYSYYFEAVAWYDAGGDGTGTGTWLESETSNSIDLTTLNRPDNWAWTTNFYSGKEYDVDANKNYYIMPATEWSDFQDRINEFRSCKGLSQDANLVHPVSGALFDYILVNKAINSINDMSVWFSGGYNTISTTSSDQELFASLFSTLRDTLNSIS